jgi:hypothetical protein
VARATWTRDFVQCIFKEEIAMKLAIATVLSATIAVLGTNAAQAQANPPGIKLDHYACYKVTPAQPFRLRRVKLEDQFGRGEAVVVRAQFLCAPVSKNGIDVANKQDHLICYLVDSGKKANRKVETIDQFGKSILTVTSIAQLCVPALKKLL